MRCTIKGVNGMSKQIEFNESTTVLEVKKIAAELQGIPFYTFMLVFGGKILKDDTYLKDYGITSNSTIQCIENTSGGYYKIK